MSVIRLENLTKRYGKRVGIEGLNLVVPRGALFGFLGPNGSGKTTTIRVLLALLRASEGRATVFGLDCWKHTSRIKEEVGYIPGDLRLYSWLTPRFALRIWGQVRGRDLMPAGLALARRFDLEPDVHVRKMSRGMRQKLGLILALVHEPELLVLDEPTSALDPLMQQLLYEILRERVAAGSTVFFSSHALHEVEELCDRVAVLRQGKLVADETLEGLRARAGRVVTLCWKDEQAAKATAPPEFLRVVARKGRRWRGALNGPVMELVRWAAGQPLEDLSIGQPDLESLFQSFYLSRDRER